jgi:UDP-N-acetylglucosamine 2-epimerase
VNFNPVTATAPQSSTGLYVCVGTRPEIIKMAPVIDALQRSGVRPVVVHTGQHADLAWPLYDYFGLTPDIELKREPDSRTLASLSAGLLGSLDAVLADSPPRAVVVHGDTTTAAMAALSAFYRGIPVAHVEAGLRSHRLDDPFPEEFNRSLIARVARWHFAPTEHAVRNLYREGVEPDQTFLVGNTIVDATLRALARQEARLAGIGPGDPGSKQENPSGPRAPRYPHTRNVLVTLHRRENWGEPIAAMARAVFALVQAHADLQVIWPLHANPELAQQVREQLSQSNPEVRRRCHLLAPLDYPDLIEVLSEAWLVITDSGGLQEEACALKVPVLVARQGTERPELIEVGAGRLVGTDPLNLIREFERIWRDPARYQAMRAVSNPFGDGRASERIAAVLTEWLNGHSVHVKHSGLEPSRVAASWRVPPLTPRPEPRAAALLRPLPLTPSARHVGLELDQAARTPIA